MTRPILFKAKRLDTGEWVEGFYEGSFPDDGYQMHVIHTAKHELPELKSFNRWHKVDPQTVCQAIGRSVFNKQIFDEDLIVSGEIIWRVYWNSDLLQWRVEHSNGSGEMSLSKLLKRNNCKVTGNKYDKN